MYDVEKADRLYNQMLKEDKDLPYKLVDEWRISMPEEFAKRIYCERYGKHITTRDMYEEGLSFIKGQNGRPPEIWSIEEAKQILSKYIRDYEQEDFYEYDAILWLNVKRNDYPKLNENDIAYIVYRDLTDVDYYADPSERAYCWIEEHLKKLNK